MSQEPPERPVDRAASRKRSSRRSAAPDRKAVIFPRSGKEPTARRFAALGDSTRLSLLQKLSRSRPQSLAEFARGSTLTRQAIAKHLRVLEQARLDEGRRSGRERLYSLNRAPLADLRRYLDRWFRR